MGAPLLETLLAESAAAGAPAEPAWLAAARTAASAALARDGMPAPRNEAWKYTSLRALERRRLAVGDPEAATRAVDAAALRLPGVDGPMLVFVNGVFRADLSQLDALPGLTAMPLPSALRDQPDAMQALFGKDFDGVAAVFARLNTALAQDGPVIRVAAGAQLAAPLHLVYFATEASREFAWHARAAIELGEGAHARVIEHHAGATGAAHLGNLVNRVRLAAGARLELVQVQNAGEAASLVRRTDVDLAADASLAMHNLEVGAGFMRHDLRVRLAGDRARFVSRGAFVLRGRQHADTRMEIEHVARDTACDILWRGVADQRARGVFHGGITIFAGADGADAQLNNKNLLLSEGAEIDTQPVLEIHADEVKAAHGATVGQLDERALFYLRTRGIGADAARRLLTQAFCRVAIDTLPGEALREHLDALLLAHLPADVA